MTTIIVDMIVPEPAIRVVDVISPLPASLGPHAASHEPGGSDPIADLTAAVLTLTQPAALVGRGDAGPGPGQEITLGMGLAIQGTTLVAPGRSSGAWSFSFSATTTPPPTGNQIRFNAPYPYANVTTIWMRSSTIDGIDVYPALMAAAVGSRIYVQDKDDHTKFVRFRIAIAPIDRTDHVEFGVAWEADGGGALPVQQVAVVLSAGAAAAGLQSHHATHESGGTDAVTLAQSQITGLEPALAGKVDTTDPRLTNPRTPTAHKATHETGGADAIAALDAAVITTGVINAARLPAVSAGPHHATHETGGPDALTALSAAILTSGVLLNARLDPNVTLTTSLAIGATPAQTGAIRLANAQGIVARNAAGTADVSLLSLNASNQGVGPAVLNLATGIALGANPAQTGPLRLPNTGQIYWRNFANTGDIPALQVDTNNALWLGNTTSAIYISPQNFFPGSDNFSDLGSHSPSLFRWRNVSISTSVIVGTSPAQSGAIRLADTAKIVWRNSGNSADLDVLQSAAAVTVLGNATQITRVMGGTTGVEFSTAWIYPTTDGGLDCGHPSKRWRNLFVAGAVANRTKAGVPVDADVNTPTDGMAIVDTTNNKFMVRIGGVWKGVVLA